MTPFVRHPAAIGKVLAAFAPGVVHITGLSELGMMPGKIACGGRSAGEAVFTGVLRGAALASAYADMDVFVFPSLTDTFGNVVLEVVASGMPAMETPEGGPAPMVRDGVTGRGGGGPVGAGRGCRSRGGLAGGHKRALADAGSGATFGFAVFLGRGVEAVVAAHRFPARASLPKSACSGLPAQGLPAQGLPAQDRMGP